MPEPDRTFTPSAFLDRLKASREYGGPTGSVVLRGTVQPGTDDDSGPTLLFDPTGTCSSWVAVPIALVESIEVLGERSCDDHVHPLVALTFAQPSEEALVFAQLAQAAQSSSGTFQSIFSRRRSVLPPFDRTTVRRRPVPRRTFANNIPSGCASEFGQAAHSFLSAFEAAAAGDDAGAAAWADQFQTDYTLYEACVALKHTLP